jgi:tRNA-guanine family transglycosylase
METKQKQQANSIFSNQLKKEDRDKRWDSLPGTLPRRYYPETTPGKVGLLAPKDLNKYPARILRTHRGDLSFPCFLPVTTFDYQKFPLDRLLQPYFKRLVDGIMVSYHYTKNQKTSYELPTFVDSGGFASLFKNTKIKRKKEYCYLELEDGETIEPQKVLLQQSKLADIAATLDFIIPPGLSQKESKSRQNATIKNALYTLKLWQDLDEPRPLLFASIQAWDKNSVKKSLEKLAPHPFHGYALGGMVPRASNPETILEIVDAIRQEDPVRPLHVFGIGTPRLVRTLFEHGVDSVDSSTYIRQIASGRYFNSETGNFEAESNSEKDVKNPNSKKHLSNTGQIAYLNSVLNNLIKSLNYLGLDPS